MARGTYATRSQIVCTLVYLSTLPSLNSSVSFPSSQIQASSHEQTIVDIPPCLSLFTGRLPFPAKRRWRDGSNFGRLVGVRRTTNPRPPKALHGPRASGTGTLLVTISVTREVLLLLQSQILPECPRSRLRCTRYTYRRQSFCLLPGLALSRWAFGLLWPVLRSSSYRCGGHFCIQRER
jgi:hypothetical protein